MATNEEFFVSIKLKKKPLFYILYYLGIFFVIVGAKKQAGKIPKLIKKHYKKCFDL